ncbi:BapA/Bap/LapF family large adhesin [Acinetobacter lactucae]|uniref:BapA/Bap/LapF family large adhesin n=1 Tax=Acinetobacter lactucae TaxID=1785128 RepID=UPI00358DC9AD
MLNLSYPINTEVLSGAIKYSWLIGALGVVVGQTNGAAIFNTPQGTVTDAVITINSDSLLAAFDSVHLVLTRIEPDGTRTIIGNSSSVGFFDVLGIFGQSAQIQVKNLLPGKYELFMENSNLATLPGMVSVDITLKEHDITLPLVASTTAISGNVITDNDSALYGVAYGKDVVTTATVVTNIVSETGTSAAVITGFKTVIEGAYGTLTINANGSFSYLANTEAANIGKVDSFSYIISDPIGGGTDTAQLHIQINGSDVTLNWNNSDPSLDAGIFSPLANADSNTATIAVTNVVDPTIAGPSASDSWLVSILSENRILSAPFTVAVGTEADIHVNLSSGSLLSFLSSTTMNFQKLAADGITWVTLDTVTAGSLADLIGLFGAGATGIYNNVQEGTYRFQLNYSTGKGIAGSISLDTEITTTHLADYKLDISDTNWIHGNILTGDTAGGVADILLGSKLYVQNEVTNQYELAVGQHINTGEGTLVIQSDGSYDYQPTVFSANTDVISYKLVSVTGDESVSNLTIGIGHKFNLQDGNEFVTSTSGNDLINSSAGGSDTLIFSVLNSVDATGGNGIDTWNNFHVGNTVTDVKADQIDVSTLLYGVNSSNISGFVSLTYDGKGTAVLSIDRDGLGDTFTSSSELLTLHLDTKPANLTLQDLINNNQLLF